MNEDRVVPRCKSVYRCRDRYRRRFARILLSLMQQRNCLLPRTRSRSSRYTILQRLSAVLYRHDSRAFIDERFFLERDALASQTSQGDNRLKWLFPTEETSTDIFYVQRTRSLWSNRAFVFFGSFQSFAKIDDMILKRTISRNFRGNLLFVFRMFLDVHWFMFYSLPVWKSFTDCNDGSNNSINYV